jgi:tRNA pseudouridine38-40 synthase
MDMLMRNIKIVLEYEGTAYHGWQRQANGMSIQQLLEEKIGIITREKIKVVGSGRTDAGVHALNQVANFRMESTIGEKNLLDGVNSLLPRDIAIKSLIEVDASFHARRDVISKIYCYQVYNSSVRPAVQRNYSWAVYPPLDVDQMRQAAEMLRGAHDFTSFSTVHTDVKDFTRKIKDINIIQDNSGMIRFLVEADGFLRYMVRTIVGTLVDVGKGKRSAESMASLLDAKDRNQAGMTAPPQGLFLQEVKY